MKRILVTTGLSVNSKAGTGFAIQLASQNNYKLTFFYDLRRTSPINRLKKELDAMRLPPDFQRRLQS